jgi:hypothetical protein
VLCHAGAVCNTQVQSTQCYSVLAGGSYRLTLTVPPHSSSGSSSSSSNDDTTALLLLPPGALQLVEGGDCEQQQQHQQQHQHQQQQEESGTLPEEPESYDDPFLLLQQHADAAAAALSTGAFAAAAAASIPQHTHHLTQQQLVNAAEAALLAERHVPPPPPVIPASPTAVGRVEVVVAADAHRKASAPSAPAAAAAGEAGAHAGAVSPDHGSSTAEAAPAAAEMADAAEAALLSPSPGAAVVHLHAPPAPKVHGESASPPAGAAVPPPAPPMLLNTHQAPASTAGTSAAAAGTAATAAGTTAASGVVEREGHQEEQVAWGYAPPPIPLAGQGALGAPPAPSQHPAPPVRPLQQQQQQQFDAAASDASSSHDQEGFWVRKLTTTMHDSSGPVEWEVPASIPGAAIPQNTDFSASTEDPDVSLGAGHSADSSDSSSTSDGSAGAAGRRLSGMLDLFSKGPSAGSGSDLQQPDPSVLAALAGFDTAAVDSSSSSSGSVQARRELLPLEGGRYIYNPSHEAGSSSSREASVGTAAVTGGRSGGRYVWTAPQPAAQQQQQQGANAAAAAAAGGATAAGGQTRRNAALAKTYRPDEYPVPVITLPNDGAVTLMETSPLELDGSASLSSDSDPIISWTWAIRMISPQELDLTHTIQQDVSEPTANVVLTVPGSYVVGLTVESETGVSHWDNTALIVIGSRGGSVGPQLGTVSGSNGGSSGSSAGGYKWGRPARQKPLPVYGEGLPAPPLAPAGFWAPPPPPFWPSRSPPPPPPFPPTVPLCYYTTNGQLPFPAMTPQSLPQYPNQQYDPTIGEAVPTIPTQQIMTGLNGVSVC